MAIIINATNPFPCSQCRPGKTEHLNEIGQRVCWPAKSQTDYSFYQCATCGRVWQRTEDSGLGGHSTFWKPLTS